MNIDPQAFRAAAAALFGRGYQAKMARELKVSTRTVRRWASGDTPVPQAVLDALGIRLQQHPVPKWLIGETEEEREYIIHLESPRFIAEILEDEELVSGVAYITLGGDQLCHLTWLDLPPKEPEAERNWLTRAAEALTRYSAAIAE